MKSKQDAENKAILKDERGGFGGRIEDKAKEQPQEVKEADADESE